MELLKEKKLKTQFIMLLFCFFKDIQLHFNVVVTHLVAPFIVFAPNRVVSRFENL
jgi:hypothetical protein